MRTYIHYGHKHFDITMFAKVRNIKMFTKPEGGFWGSDVNAELGWENWCENNDFRKCEQRNSFLFTLQEEAKILYINTVDDLNVLPKCKGVSDFNQWFFLDFEEISKEYDAIEVVISNDYGLYYKLYGWDCDSILVLNSEVIVEI